MAEDSFEKLNIQWFPGHMTKAQRMIEENIRLVDAVCEILDAHTHSLRSHFISSTYCRISLRAGVTQSASFRGSWSLAS